jgi:hypothetical protein
LTRFDHKQEQLAAMRAANPVSVEELRATLTEQDLGERLRRIVAGAEPPPAGADPLPPVRAPRRRLALAFAGALACVAAAAALLLGLGGGSVGGGGQRAFAAAAIRVAEANPRLLVTAPGWVVIDAGEFERDEGEVTFANGGRRFTVHWYPARLYRSYLRDRASVSKPRRSTLLGRAATTIRYDLNGGGAEYATMLAPQGPVFIEARGGVGDRAAYDAVLHALRPVDVETWLAAMPPDVVGPDSRARVVRRMLQGVPLPPDFDSAALQGEDSVLDHYQLAVKVAGTVSCGWFESWLSATKAGDGARAHEAVTAMSTWSRWPMTPTIGHGGWATNLKMAAAELADGNVDRGPAGRVVNPDGSGYVIGPSWAVWLNCTDRVWRRPIEP